jgi:hypothetical protein
MRSDRIHIQYTELSLLRFDPQTLRIDFRGEIARYGVKV